MSRRQEFSRKTKLAEWQDSGGCCRNCGRKIQAGERREFDHRIPCELGGDNSQENCEVLCDPCHKEKTKKDVRDMAKCRSVQAGHVGAKAPKRKIAGSKGTGWRVKMDGTVVRVKE